MHFTRKKISLQISRGKLFCALLVPTAIVLTAFGFGRGKTNRSIATTEPATRADTSTMLFQDTSSATRLDAEHVTLRRTGFEPEEFTRPAGRFLLSIDNLSELGELTFRLVRQNGNLERDLPAKQDKYRLRHVVDLSPGRYALVVVDHPAWVCHITITAQ